MATLYSPNARVLVRDRAWTVRTVKAVQDGVFSLELVPVDRGDPLTVIAPPEIVTPLPSSELEFSPRGLTSLSEWTRLHRALAAGFVRHDDLTGARFGRVAIEGYQLAPLLRVLAQPRPSLLIADDVGLGKTVEAGLIILELIARRRADRILIVVPPGLVLQWQEEMSERFGLSFRIIRDAADLAAAQADVPRGVSPWEISSRVITSLDYLKKETVRRRALRLPWDLVVVDEAHALAESGTPRNPYRTQRSRLGADLRAKSRSLILLTATPHNGYSHSFRSLLELIDPSFATIEGDPETVRTRIRRLMVRRMKRQITREENGDVIAAFPPRTVKGIAVQAAAPENELLRKIGSYCAKVRDAASGSDDEDLVSFAMQIIKKRSLSSRRALAVTIDRRLEALRKPSAEEPPGRAEIRELQADLPLTESLADRIAGRVLRSAVPSDEKRRRSELKMLNAIRKHLDTLPETDPKIEACLAEIRAVLARDPDERFIVFTEYLDTLESLREAMEAAPEFAGRIVVLRGGMSPRERREARCRFETDPYRILLATDAASEGLNLQRRCRRIVHIELPWNPNRLEQRNGRVDRYGQTRPPEIRYLFYPGSPEDEILHQLVGKIEEMARTEVSTPDVLGVLEGAAIADSLTALDPEATDADERGRAILRTFDDRTADFIRDVRPLVMTGDEPFDANILDRRDPLLPDDEAFEALMLATLDGAIRPHRDHVYRIDPPLRFRGHGVRERYPAATFRRSVAARSTSAEIEYVTPEHPLGRAVIEEARRRLVQVYPDENGLPSRRLAARAVPRGEKPGILFTFAGTIMGADGVLDEQIIAVRVDSDGTISGGMEKALDLLEKDACGEVSFEKVEAIGGRFAELRAAAKSRAEELLAARAEEIRRARNETADRLLRDLERSILDRRTELERERAEARTRADGAQLRLGFDAHGRDPHAARLAALEAEASESRRMIEAFREVHAASAPSPLGALILVPEDR